MIIFVRISLERSDLQYYNLSLHYVLGALQSRDLAVNTKAQYIILQICYCTVVYKKMWINTAKPWRTRILEINLA